MTATTGTRYVSQRGALQTYFDRTAVEAWARLTSDAPLGRIRRTVRAGREEMRATLLSWLPQDLTGRRLLDAGCGTGALAVEAARRGADVVAVDLSPTLLGLARARLPADLGPGRVTFLAGDMLADTLGRFDHIVAMDSLIHYHAADIVRVLESFSARAARSVLFTYAPRTPLLAAMHAVGRLFPRGDRAPAIQPVAAAAVARRIGASAALGGWRAGRAHRVDAAFYISAAQELVPA